MQLYLIRHGQSQNNLGWAQQGEQYSRFDDPELTEIGVRQAECLACFLGGPSPAGNRLGLTHLYTSLMVRAVSTAVPIAAAVGLPLYAWADWHESGGIFRDDPETGEPQGLPGPGRSFFEQRYPTLILSPDLDERGWWNRPHETRQERPLRAQRVLDELRVRHGEDDCVAVVGHGQFFNYVLWAILGLQRDDGIWFVVHNASITRLDFVRETRIGYTNRTDFIPDDLITA